MNSLWARVREQGSALWDSMNRGQRIALLAGMAGVVIALIFLLGRFNSNGFVPLFTRLRPDDAGEIVAALRDRGVPYRLSEQGSTVLVPQDTVYEARLDLAAQGIPRRGVVGFEIFQDSPIGTTDFERMVRYQQALQGELVRTIRELSEVIDARVHVTLPERSPFLREQRGATASVLLHLRAPLRQQQVRGIAHLVAASVENLHPDQVTILDSDGHVLWDGGRTAAEPGGIDVQTRFELQRAFERDLERSVQSMLEQVFGPGRAVARVRARLNFDRLEEREELFEPVVRDRGILRSQQRLQESFQGVEPLQAGGVPGVEANIPGYVGMQAAPGRGERLEEISNFEVNRRERFRIVAPGAVEGLSVAVWVDGDLGPAERQRVEDTVASALGLDSERGDQITVESFAFERGEPVLAAVAAPPRSPFEGPWPWVALLALSLAVILVAGRRRRVPEPAPARVDVRVDDEEAELAPPPISRAERIRRSRQEAIEAMVRENPEHVANLLRTWLVEDER